jgi:protein subunit release factor B
LERLLVKNHQNCCRITHIETGLQAISTDRERASNQRKAFTELAKRILAYYQRIEAEAKIKPSAEVIRNYNESRNEVHDKASGLKMPYKTVVTGNNIAPMIEARNCSALQVS